MCLPWISYQDWAHGISYLADRLHVAVEALDDQQEQPGDVQKWWYSTFHRSGRLGSSAPQTVPESSSKPKVDVSPCKPLFIDLRPVLC